MERDKICIVCQDFEANVGHQAEWCPNITCQKCGQPGHTKIQCMTGLEGMPLPNEVLLKVINFLNPKDLARCAQVNRKFRDVVCENPIYMCHVRLGDIQQLRGQEEEDLIQSIFHTIVHWK